MRVYFFTLLTWQAAVGYDYEGKTAAHVSTKGLSHHLIMNATV